MKRYTVLIAIFATAFFAVGIGWGMWTRKKQADELAKSTPLRVLCHENWISEEFLDRFSRDHNVRIQLFTFKRPSEFLRQMANADGNVDVICTSSLLVKSLVHNHWLKKINGEAIPNLRLLQ